MAIKRNVLLEELDRLRDELINKVSINQDDRIQICSDEALREIVKKKPLKKSDFLAISGLSKNFIDEYADLFLVEINKHRNAQTREVNVSNNASKVLHHYKDRLTNISKTNPNLYMGKIEKIRNFDLYQLKQDSEIIAFLTNPKIKKLKFNLPSEELLNSITTLYREINKALKETGSYNLYIAYPYVEGIFKKERFAIKAPLLYFPVKIDRTKKEFTLAKDDKKDIIFNRDLLLVTSKIENNNIDANMPQINSFDMNILREVVIPFYEKHGFIVNNVDYNFNFIETKNELKDDFMKNTSNTFEYKQYITLGRYKLYSSMIQKDMETILTANKYNELLEGLIDEDNLYQDEITRRFDKENDIVFEDEITYINDLNDAQEHVINLLSKEKRIVIWGPPGTGKSQTITSLISSSINKGENVLIVSEKKVALDVIYSRLKNASKYVMFVDDAENKQAFYDKMKLYVDPKPPIRTRNNDIFMLDQEINEIQKTLDTSLNLLFKKGIDNIKVNDLYDRYLKDKEVDERLTPQQVFKMFVTHYKHKVYFKEIKQIEESFSSDNELKEYLDFHTIKIQYPLINKLETKISRSGKIELTKFNDSYLETKQTYDKANFISKYFIKKAFIKQHKNDVLFLTKKDNISKKYLNILFNISDLHNYIMDNTLKIDKIKTKYEKLDKQAISYLDMLIFNPLVNKITDIHKYRKYLFDAFYTGFLEEYKTNNQRYLYMIDDYINKANKLNELMNEKMYVSIESFEMNLYQYALNFANSKRIMDIKRVLESNNKPSIKTFIDIFQPEMLENVRIWMMTPEVVSAIMPLKYGIFDLVIFDEASQMYVEKGIPAIYRSKKVVIAGDPKQLRPSSLGMGRISEEDDFFESEDSIKEISLDAKSLLDLARYKYHEALLNYHYRSEYEELIAFSNHAFYDGKLIVSPNQVNAVKPPIEYVYVENALYDNKKNHAEAKSVVELIKKIFRQRENNETIGVITFNSTQRDLIENYIDQEVFKKSVYQKKFENELMRNEDNEDKSLFVKNIENVQGDERDIIIFSMGYAKDSAGKIKRRFGWLNHEGGENRLNVAITRAKKKIYFVSSLYPEEFKVDDLQSKGPKLLKDFMRYCYFVATKNIELAKTVLNKLNATEIETKNAISSKIENDVKIRLEKNGYTVHAAIGIGDYTINLGIYDEQSNAYVLGIICDISDETNINSRKDLIHQEKYLRSRNWNIYRVFSANWYINPNKEIKQIKDLIKETLKK